MDTRARYYLLRHRIRYHRRKAEVVLPGLIDAATGRSPERLIERLKKRREHERAAVVITYSCLARMLQD